MLIRVLGPVVVVRDDGSSFEPPSEGQRRLLVLLAIRAGRAVAADTICDLFALSPGAVRTTISRLRKTLGSALVTEPLGYALRADTDVQRFQTLVASARTADPEHAAQLRRDALALYGAPALDEFSDEPWARAEVARLAELRSAIVEDLVEWLIISGRHDDAIDELHRHIVDHPYRDRPQELLMMALTASGRQVEALRAFQEYRNLLVDEAGVDPGPSIVELDRRIAMGEVVVAPSMTQVRSRAVDRAPSNVPIPANDFVGRGDELVAIGAAVAESRLVTLLGGGGVGKTRLAYQFAADHCAAFADGVWVVELVNGKVGADVLRTIAECLGLSGSPTASNYAEQLSGHELLLVLDNCEHLVAHLIPIVDTLLSRTTRLRILATSRERLGIVGESSIVVEPLGTDGDAQDLFVRRAAAVGGRFDDRDLVVVGDICRRLDGIPLAVELAAASSRHLTPLELLDRLDDRFAILKGGPRGLVAGRHESLRAAVDSSYESLDDPTRRFFRRIAVYASDFPLGAAEAAAEDLPLSAIDLVGVLVDRSLLTAHVEHGRSRYRLLETLRQYGADRLAELGELDDAIERHVRWCFAFCENHARTAFGSAEVGSINELVSAGPNIRVAISRLLDSGQGRRAGDLVLHLEDFGYASNTIASLVGPVVEAAAADDHPQRQRLLAMELIRRATSGSTEGRGELARDLSAGLTAEAAGTVHLAVLLIATALKVGPGAELIARVLVRAESETNTVERARLLTAAGLGAFYGDDPPEDLALVEAAMAAARKAGMKRLTIAAASMACIGGLRLAHPALAAEIAQPLLADLAELGHASIMSNGLIAMYTEAAIQAGLPAQNQLAAMRFAGPNLYGDFNRLGLALARLVQHHGHHALAVRALGACATSQRSEFSAGMRIAILEGASRHLSACEVEALLATGAVSEATDLYREMWAILEPLMD